MALDGGQVEVGEHGEDLLLGGVGPGQHGGLELRHGPPEGVGARRGWPKGR